MKKYILISCILIFLLLFGCSEQTEKPYEYKGENGTYEITDAHTEDSVGLLKEYTQLKIKVKYTNTTSKAKKPIDSFLLDMVIEHETDIELNEIEFTKNSYAGGKLTEEQELVNNGSLNIKPKATVEIIVESVVEKDKLDSIFLRNKNERGQNGDIFEKQIEVKE